MNLKEALRLQKGAVVTFVGAGGKTSSMFRLADELAAAGWAVVTTTTTRIFNSQLGRASAFVELEADWSDRAADAVRDVVAEFGHCLVVGPTGEGEKRYGVSPDVVTALHALQGMDAVLVEADGSRMRPFKAPADHEPVVPAVTTRLVPVVGVDVVGRTLDAEYVHRPERVAAIADVPLGSEVTPALVAHVLSHPEGGAKARPPTAWLVPLINKVEDDADLIHARLIADRLLATESVDSVLVGAVQREPPVREAWERIAGIVLAAGESTRYGDTTKQLLSWGETTLVGRAAQVALDAGLDPVVVVTGYDAERVATAVADLPVQTVHNTEYAVGQSTSVRRGVEALTSNVGGAAFLMADTPNVTADVVRRIVQAHRESLAPIVIPTYDGRRGNPVLFDRALFDELRTIGGDKGGRTLFDAHRDEILRIAVNEPGILEDVDTPGAYDRLLQR